MLSTTYPQGRDKDINMKSSVLEALNSSYPHIHTPYNNNKERYNIIKGY